MRKLLTIAAAALLLSLATPVLGQKKESRQTANTRSLEGVVTDGSESPLDGAVVQLKDTKSLQIRSFITRNDGKFHFHGLSSDIDYEVRADYQGKSSQQKTLSSFDSRKSAVLNLKIEK